MQDKVLQYELERGKRWTCAKDGEPEAMEEIRKSLFKYYEISCEPKRYDTEYFNKYKYLTPEWVRGASDYSLNIEGVDFLIEIKLKNKKFRKTIGGGLTKDGSVIRDYGCESYYLDKVPVYKNMCDFCAHENINPEYFIVFFCGEGNIELRYISLAEIKALVEHGYKGEPLTEFGEGYGIDTGDGRAITYLIPEDTTTDISDKKKVFVKKDRLSELLRQYMTVFYGCNTSGYTFYHLDRQCRAIRNKPESDISIFFSEEEALSEGYLKCTYCGGN